MLNKLRSLILSSAAIISLLVIPLAVEPANAAVGDLTDIGTSIGNKGWNDLISNSDGTKLLACNWTLLGGGSIYYSSNSGYSWTNLNAGNKNWQHVVADSTFTTFYAVAYGGGIWKSTDTGSTWSDISPAGTGSSNWYSIDVTPDGTKLIASVDNGYIYTSTDSGATWTQRTNFSTWGVFGKAMGQATWRSVAISSDGTKMQAANFNSAPTSIYRSVDSGASWQTQAGTANLAAGKVLLSANGSTVLAAPNGGLSPKLSTDGGDNWAHVTGPPGGANSYQAMTMSDSGNVMFVANRTGQIWKSSDKGTTWNEVTSTPTPSSAIAWNALALGDGDGETPILYGAVTNGSLWGPVPPTPPSAPGFSGSVTSIPDTLVSTSSASQTVTVTNNGNADLVFGTGANAVSITGTNSSDYSISVDGCSGQTVAASGTCTVTFTFTPGATGTRTASMIFSDNATGSPHSVSLSGVGVSPGFSASTPSIPDTNVGSTSATQTETITNSGGANLVFGASAVTLTGSHSADYTIELDNCSNTSVAPAGTCTVTYTFHPSIRGTRTASLNFTDNAPNSPQSISLSGIGLSPEFSGLAPTIADTNVGSTTTGQLVTVTNDGNSNLVFGASAVTLSGTNGPDFAISADNCSNQAVAPSATCTVALSFIPSGAGTRTANLNFTDNASGSPHAVAISAVGLAPSLSYTLTSFPDTAIGQTSAAQTLTVTNDGNLNLVIGAGPLTIGGASPGSFTIVSDGCSGQTIAPASTCVITISFTPASAGTSTAELSIASNDPASPSLVSLSAYAPATSTGSQVVAPPDVVTEPRIKVTPKLGALFVELTYDGERAVSPTYYIVTASPSGNTCIIHQASGGCTILGLDPNVQYAISVVAANHFGLAQGYRTSGTYSPLSGLIVKDKAKYNLINFKGDSAKLTKQLKSKIAKFLHAHKTLTSFTCTGFTAGKPVLKTDKALAKARALAVCNYILKLRPKALVTQLGKTPGAPFGAKYRKVVIFGFS